ncbi:DUF2087 domain-containing protein [Arthrobacter sp. NPDC055585]
MATEQQLVQFLAAMANAGSRMRFGELALAETGKPRLDNLDRLLLESGVALETDNSVRISATGIVALLEKAREQLKPKNDAPLEHLPRKRNDRIKILRSIAASIFAPGETIDESELGDRLAPLVTDVAALRRAMFDEGLIDRDASTQRYWRRENSLTQTQTDPVVSAPTNDLKD